MESISAAVCTRDRGARLLSTVRSILANDDPNFEVIVIDQNEDDDVAHSIEKEMLDPRIIYIRSASRGVGRARNLALTAAKSRIVAFADDDVTVPRNWLNEIRLGFGKPTIAMMFFNVAAAPFGALAGFVPTYQRVGSTEIGTLAGKCKARGIGAGMAIDRVKALSIGGFDALLGPGGRFGSCEEGDLAVRCLIYGFTIYETDRLTVTHDGFRTWVEGRELARRDWIGIGAAYSKPLKAKHWSVLSVLLYEGVYLALVAPLRPILSLKRPRGVRRFVFFWHGFWLGLRTPIDRRTLRFLDQ